MLIMILLRPESSVNLFGTLANLVLFLGEVSSAR